MIGAIVSIGLQVKPWNEAKFSSHQIPDFYNVIPKRTLRKVKPHQKTSRNIQHWAKWSQRCPNIRFHCVLFYCRMVLSSLSINCCASREGSFLLERTIKMARNDIKKSLSALHFEKFRKVRKLDKIYFFILEIDANFNNFQGLSGLGACRVTADYLFPERASN